MSVCTVAHPREHWLTRMFFGLSAVIFAGCLAAAADDTASLRTCADPGGPSNFDYLVLASLADSPHLVAMAGYRSTVRWRAEPVPRVANDSAHRDR